MNFFILHQKQKSAGWIGSGWDKNIGKLPRNLIGYMLGSICRDKTQNITFLTWVFNQANLLKDCTIFFPKGFHDLFDRSVNRIDKSTLSRTRSVKLMKKRPSKYLEKYPSAVSKIIPIIKPATARRVSNPKKEFSSLRPSSYARRRAGALNKSSRKSITNMVVPNGRKTNNPVRKALRNRLERLTGGKDTEFLVTSRTAVERVENQAKQKVFLHGQSRVALPSA